MNRKLLQVGLGMATLSLLACNSLDEASLEQKAVALSRQADACLVDVRDNGAKYDTSPYCMQLSPAAQAYISAGGQTPEEPAEIELIAEGARATAWSAAALSAGAEPTIW